MSPPPNKKPQKQTKNQNETKGNQKTKKPNKNKRLELVYLSREKFSKFSFGYLSHVTSRIKTFLNKSIRIYQTGFFFGRYRLQGKIINQYDLINYTVINYIPCVTVMIDFGKAFDSLAREFIQLF